jgi:hypothetical protein
MSLDRAHIAGDRPLALHAVDKDDLAVVAAHLQDAVVRRADMTWRRRERRFVVMANRFRWEDGARADGQRTRTGLHFDFVQAVKTRNLPAEDDGTPLNLLTVSATPGADEAAVVALVFAGGAEVRLDVECIDCWLRDVSAPWPAIARPDHGL